MQTAAITSRFLTGCSSLAGFADAEGVVSNQGLVHHIVANHLIRTVGSQELFLKLTNEVIQFAEQAYLRRDLDSLEEASQMLVNLPVEAARQIGLYYYALAVKRRGDLDQAQTLFEAVADNASIAYRARAIQGLGANYLSKGQLDEALRFQLEALRMSSDKDAHGLQTMLMAHWDIAIVRSLAGDHKGSLGCFEKLWPLVCQIAKRQPFYVYKYHNALAVELSETGRIEEAKAASKIALASPFASAYPEWIQTRDDLNEKDASAAHSVVAIAYALKDDISPQPEVEQQRNPKPISVLARLSLLVLSWLVGDCAHFQTAITCVVTPGTTINHQTTCETLERLGNSIKSRAPPQHTGTQSH
ncbi:MAG: tetratricopeptide repeat protein [Acidobacteriota bacterium]